MRIIASENALVIIGVVPRVEKIITELKEKYAFDIGTSNSIYEGRIILLEGLPDQLYAVLCELKNLYCL